MTQPWTLAGDYVEACNCDVACRCIWMVPTDDDGCTASLAWHIRDGHYGDVDLSGLSVGLLIAADAGVMFGPGTEWDVVLLVDETADDEQREALQTIYTGGAGGIWAAVAEAHVRSAEVVSAPIEFVRDGEDVTVEIGEVLDLAAAGIAIGGDELGTIRPHPLTADGVMHTGLAESATVSFGEAFDWSVSGTNAFLGDFQLANS